MPFDCLCTSPLQERFELLGITLGVWPVVNDDIIFPSRKLASHHELFRARVTEISVKQKSQGPTKRVEFGSVTSGDEAQKSQLLCNGKVRERAKTRAQQKLMEVTSLVKPSDWLSVFAACQSTHSHSEDTFKSITGCSSTIMHTIWVTYLAATNMFLPRDLLWTLSFLHLYIKNDVAMAALWGVSSPTFFDIVWPCFHYLGQVMNEIHWEHRLPPYSFVPTSGFWEGTTVVIDTTECPIASTFRATYSGYKRDHTFKYELGVQIASGEIVWAPTPGFLGPEADQNVFGENKIIDLMLPNEKFVGDGHYIGLPHSLIQTPEKMTENVAHVRAIIEHVFGRLKEFHCLATAWRHNENFHYVAWQVCVHVTNMKLTESPIHEHPHILLLTSGFESDSK